MAAAGGLHTVLVLEDGSVEAFGSNSFGQTDVPNLSGLKVVAKLGSAHPMIDASTANATANSEEVCTLRSQVAELEKQLAAAQTSATNAAEKTGEAVQVEDSQRLKWEALFDASMAVSEWTFPKNDDNMPQFVQFKEVEFAKGTLMPIFDDSFATLEDSLAEVIGQDAALHTCQGHPSRSLRPFLSQVSKGVQRIVKHSIWLGIQFGRRYIAEARRHFIESLAQNECVSSDNDLGAEAANLYSAALKLKMKRDSTFANGPSGPSFLEHVDAIKTKVTDYNDSLDKVQDPCERLLSFYVQASIMKRKYFMILIEQLTSIVDDFSGHAGVQVPSQLKAFPRVLEKFILRPDEGLPWDPVRAMMICKTFAKIIEIIEKIMSFDKLKLVACNNRFAEPKNGWADVALYVQFDDPHCGGVVAEIQLVINELYLAREQMGGHEVYGEGRFTAELVRKFEAELNRMPSLPACLPWSRVNELLDSDQ
eukprot:gnl/MRDRNA2_/MRDRNA2_83487_c0_seq6.p1 gnl/MRDRNA2_/MRDRNA2_83487_c0~~gnl/MRDRNA2_/MRDRNA2_83487_c0_seq6.p1  ORF type:complete len:507 (+),score=123.19 gnl/MRDRNA2_/MRDRNA2_83487_c0_seq6:87-1523(+)